MKKKPVYRGRFAPSPTGPLHFGSLYTAVASYLQAKSNNGKWLLRIDDLDPFRCKPQYTTAILNTLEKFGLYWDEDVFYQSTRHSAYQDALTNIEQLGLLYPCQCSRKSLAERQSYDGIYDGYCLNHPTDTHKPHSLRIKLPDNLVSFIDVVQGKTQQAIKKQAGDFIMFRKDQVYAYHLAVVLDDNEQNVTEILRGYDLLDSTYRQIFIQHLLQIATPEYAHIPVISDAVGVKLSKQTFASDVSLLPVRRTLINVFRHLNLNPTNELVTSSPNDILQWGVQNWSLRRIQALPSISFKQY